MQLKALAIALFAALPSCTVLADVQRVSQLGDELRASLTDMQSVLDAYEGNYAGLASIQGALSRTRKTVDKCEASLANSPSFTSEESASVANNTEEVTTMLRETLNTASVKVPMIKAKRMDGMARRMLQPAYEQDMRYTRALQAKLRPEDAEAVAPMIKDSMDAYEALFRSL
ncbi:hypothetical protein HK57_00424 [Aspergillus ustus]|uniref:Hydrophobic surface binding protein A n=1 Tax=Aspergillus ustus TaxID=40382 RepID=A0A0C1C403_ASPUT|nr:hypothetical protein HK57_00424 [Aspergillus ustus]